MDWAKQFSITDNFKNRVVNTVEFIFGVIFLLFVLRTFGWISQFVADKIRPNHSFENEYVLLKILPYFIPFLCGVALSVYSYIVGYVRNKKFQLRSKTGWYIFLASFLPVFLSTVFFFVDYFYLIDESRLVETRVEEFAHASFLGTILFGMISIGLTIYFRNKYSRVVETRSKLKNSEVV